MRRMTQLKTAQSSLSSIFRDLSKAALINSYPFSDIKREERVKLRRECRKIIKARDAIQLSLFVEYL